MNNLPFSLHVFEKTRKTVLNAVDGLSAEQLLKTPVGFSNNIAWNLGHIIAVQQGMVYWLSGLDGFVSAEFKDRYWPNTSPADWSSSPDVDELKSMLMSHTERVLADYGAGKFEGITYQSRTSGSGIYMDNLQDTFHYNNYHEGLHLGAIQAIKEFV